jgi:hypothetical protein
MEMVWDGSTVTDGVVPWRTRRALAKPQLVRSPPVSDSVKISDAFGALHSLLPPELYSLLPLRLRSVPPLRSGRDSAWW